MASLADSFLKDFEDEIEDIHGTPPTPVEASATMHTQFVSPVVPGESLGEGHEAQLEPTVVCIIPDAIQEYIGCTTKPKEKLVKLLQDEPFVDFIQQLKLKLNGVADSSTVMSDVSNSVQLGRQAALKTLGICNDYLRDVDVEILSAHGFIRDLYNNRFPELEPLLPAPLDYITTATRLRNELDVTASSLSDFLPSATIMMITVAASITIGRPLSPAELDKILSVAEDVFELVEARKVILAYIEQDLVTIAPNLTALVGSSMAARLLVYAESLENLSTMPSGNIPLLGGSAHARSTTAFSTAQNGITALPAAARSAGKGYGILWQSDIVQSTPPAYRVRALKLLAGKCGLAARRDAYNPFDEDAIGRQLREQVLATLKRLQEPPPPTQKKALPVPDERPKPRRGGKRYRRTKEKYGMSELKKKMNRMEMKIV
eukprot:Gregarina_sp_Poly_1__5997@NODE_315_length_9587_cov_683_543592_g270_i0_p3_GENE_NODE_315_length_9587_cov_683_543592_g270_i0NODE_315_length_9587_cov_683_543592_g270_i0_p3_ORF_typecomplete_len432_score68_38Nop/PF01798_18/6_2e52Prp31_C/PF09785_9/9_7e13_NODE_315_length_9587_cov_683_543592_g270_i056286923